MIGSSIIRPNRTPWRPIAAAGIVIESTTDSLTTTDQTSHTVALPATVNAGDLLIVFFASDANPTVTWDNSTAGTWTQNLNDSQVANRISTFSKVADGTEDGLSLTVTTSTAQQVAARVFRLSGVQGTISAAGTGARGTSTAPDPLTITASWGSAANLYIAAVSIDNAAASEVTAGPTGYSTPSTIRTSASGQVGLSTAYKVATSSSDDPSAFTLANSRGWVCSTVAVRPA